MNQHDIDAFMENGAYVLSVKILRGKNQMGLSPQILGIDEEAAQSFSKQGITKNSITILGDLKRAGERLENMRRTIQTRHMFKSGGLSFVKESDLPKVWEIVQEMEAERTKAIVELKESKYQESFEDFKKRLFTALEAVHGADDPVKLLALVTEAEKSFPSIEQVEKSFRIEMLGPFPIQSIKERVIEDSELQVAEAEKAQAKALQELVAYQKDQVREKLHDAIHKAETEIAASISEVLTNLSDVDKSAMPARLKTKFNTVLEEFNRLGDIDSSLKDMLDQMESLGDNFDQFESEDFKTKLSSLKQNVGLFEQELKDSKPTESDSMIF